MAIFRGTTNCDLRIPYKESIPGTPTFPFKLYQNWVALERWATYLTRNCLPTGGGMPQGWCGEDYASSSGTNWNGTILTIAANTISTTAPMLAVDLIIDIAIATAATYTIEFQWTNSGDSEYVSGFTWRDVVSDVDGGTVNRRLPSHCLMETAHLGDDWEFDALVYGSNAVNITTHWKAVEVTTGIENPCCEWSQPT